LVTEIFGYLSHSYIKTRCKCLLAYIFRHSDRNDLFFFGHFKNTSVYDRKMTKKRPGMNIITFFLLPTCNFRKYADAGWSWTFAQQERNNCFGEISAFCPHRQAPFCNKRVMLKTLN